MHQSAEPLTIPISEMPRMELEFLFEPYVPLGTFISLQGPGGVGKSSITSWLAANLTSGTWGIEGSVIHIGDEDHASRVYDRLASMRADLNKYHFWNGDHHVITFPSGTEILERRIAELGVKLVILDTATEYLDDGYDINLDLAVALELLGLQ